MGILQQFKRFANKVNSFRNYHYNFEQEIEVAASKSNAILEVGCNLRPILQQSSLEGKIHHGLDPDPSIDLKKAASIFDHFYNLKIEDLKPNLKYDLIVLDMVFEHLPDNDLTLDRLKSSLSSKGSIYINVPSNLHPFSILNRVLPHDLKLRILKLLRPWSEPGDITGWPSYYDKCNIMSLKKLAKRKDMKIEKASFHYNAADYFAFFPPLFLLIVLYEEITDRLRLTPLCSHFMVVLRNQ